MKEPGVWIASFYNISQDEAYTKLKSVFTGETETLKELGVVMTENALNSYAMAKGISKTVSKMTEQEKVALRYQFVMEKLSGASGDFIRTQDSWANQTRILKLQIESLKATIGQGLINVLTPLLKMLNTLLEKLKAVANAFKSYTESFFGKSQAGGSDAGNKYVDTAEGITDSLEDVSDAAQDAEKSLKGYLNPLDEISRYETGKDNDILSGLEDIDFGQLGDLNMGVTITPEIDDSALSKKLSSLAEKVKSVLERLFRPLKEAWDREGKSVMDSWKRALDEVWKLVKDIGRDFLDVWNQEKTIAILQNVLHIISNIGLTVEKLAHNFREAWNENDRGICFTSDKLVTKHCNKSRKMVLFQHIKFKVLLRSSLFCFKEEALFWYYKSNQARRHPACDICELWYKEEIGYVDKGRIKRMGEGGLAQKLLEDCIGVGASFDVRLWGRRLQLPCDI